MLFIAGFLLFHICSPDNFNVCSYYGIKEAITKKKYNLFCQIKENDVKCTPIELEFEGDSAESKKSVKKVNEFPEASPSEVVKDVKVKDDRRLEVLLRKRFKGENIKESINRMIFYLQSEGYMEARVYEQDDTIIVERGKKFYIKDIKIEITGDVEDGEFIAEKVRRYAISWLKSRWRKALERESDALTVNHLEELKMKLSNYLKKENSHLKIVEIEKNYEEMERNEKGVYAVLNLKLYLTLEVPVEYEIHQEQYVKNLCIPYKITATPESLNSLLLKILRDCGGDINSLEWEIDHSARKIIIKSLFIKKIEMTHLYGKKSLDFSFIERFEGKTLNGEVLRKLEDLVMSSTMLRSADLQEIPAGKDFSGRDLIISVKEINRLSLSYSAGLNTIKGIEGEVSCELRKILKRSNRLKIDGGASYLPRFLYPQLPSSKIYEGRARFSYEDVMLPSNFHLLLWNEYEYKERRYYFKNALGSGAQISLVLKKINTSLIYEYEKRFKVMNRMTELPVEEKGDIGKTLFKFSIDGRDNSSNPERGYYFDVYYHLSHTYLFSDFNFMKGGFNSSFYIPLEYNIILRIYGGGGIIFSQKGDIPIDEYYFIGGAYTLRGIEEEAFIPDPYNRNAKNYLIYNIDMIIKLAGNLSVNFFNDGGIGKGQTTLARRLTAGAGLRYNTPVGPIRLEAGFNPSPRDGEPSTVIHFAIGVNI